MPSIDACRPALRRLSQAQSANAGMLLTRYVEKLGPDASEERCQIQKSATSQKDQVYSHAYTRWLASLDPNGTPRAVCLKKDLPVQGRLITGLGAASPLETGISLHHTYGVPWMPGSGLKGLAAHYCDQIWGAADNNFRKEGSHYTLLFGTTKRAGVLAFHDGWWVPGPAETPLIMDIMTPHHGDYYQAKTGHDTATDFDTPVPVSFLSVQGKFSVAVECLCDPDQMDEGKKWATLGVDLLTEALTQWGFGGKTSSGYGRMGSTAATPAAPATGTADAQNALPDTGAFRKKGDLCAAVVSNVTGQFKVKLQIADTPEVNCAKGNFSIGAHVIVEARDWPKGQKYPQYVAVVKML